MNPDATGPTCGSSAATHAAGEGDAVGVSHGADDARLREEGDALERAVLALLDRRASGATICPSEAARAVGGEDWRGLMDPARAAALRLVARGEVEITQGGTVVDGSTANGPIRIRRAHRG